MKNRILDNQKPFSRSLNTKYDSKGKSILEEILKQGSYTDIVIRKNEMYDSDKSFWDVKGTTRHGNVLYFDVEVKEFWKTAGHLPDRVLEDGFSFPNRKSVSHNPRQNKSNFLVIISADLCGAFFVAKDVFENTKPFEKPTKFGTDKFRNIPIAKGIMFLKKDGIWQKQ